MRRSYILSHAMAVALGIASSLGAQAGSHAPTAVLTVATVANDFDLPPRARRGTGVNGDFNPVALDARDIRFSLADGRELRAVRTRAVKDSRRGQSWIGEFEGMPGSLVVITRYRGVVTGFLQHGADLFELLPGKHGRAMLYEVDPQQIPPNSQPLLAPVTSVAQGVSDLGAGQAVTTAASGIVQDLLVLYTPAAASSAGNEATLQSQIVGAVEAANAAYASSQVGITLNLVGMALTPYQERGDMTLSLTSLAAPFDGVMDEAHPLRDQLGADLVALVSDDTNYCGISYLMTSVSASFAPYAFGVTSRSCLSNHTLAHEIGHNQGNQHDRDTVLASGGSAGAYPYSFGYRSCGKGGFRTVMAYSCTGAPRVNYFSNPNVLYQGKPTGISYEASPSGAAENARSMGNTAAVVASFRASVGPVGTPAAPPEAPGDLTAAPVDSTGVTLRWTDTALDETGFEIWRSASGAAETYTLVGSLGPNTTYWLDNGLAPLTYYWWQVRAYNSAGSSAFSSAAATQTFAPPPIAPTLVTAALIASPASVQVVWTDRSTNETGFEVRRESLNTRGVWQLPVTVGSVAANVATYVDAPGAGTYRYSVRALNEGGASDWSPPSAPVKVAKGRK